MPSSNYENLALPVGILLLFYFLSKGTKKEEEEEDYSAFGGGARDALMRPAPAFGEPIKKPYGEQTSFETLFQQVREEGGDVTAAYIKEAKGILENMNRGIDEISFFVREGRKTNDRKAIERTRVAVEKFQGEFGGLDNVADKYMKTLDDRATKLRTTLDDTAHIYVFGVEENAYSQFERVDLVRELDELINDLRMMQSSAREVLAQSREQIEFRDKVTWFESNQDEDFDDDSESRTPAVHGHPRESGGGMPSAPPDLRSDPNFLTFKSGAHSRLKPSDFETTVAQLNFDDPAENTEVEQSFNSLPGRLVNPSQLTRQKKSSPLKDLAPREQSVEGAPEFDAFKTPAAKKRVQQGSAPPATPLSRLYKDQAVYKREIERLTIIVEDSQELYDKNPVDEQSKAAILNRLKTTQPHRFETGAWYAAASGKTAASLSNGKSMLFEDLMEESVFSQYVHLMDKVAPDF